jgi:hypothetical protein
MAVDFRAWEGSYQAINSKYEVMGFLPHTTKPSNFFAGCLILAPEFWLMNT